MHPGELRQELLTQCCFGGNTAPLSPSPAGARFEFSPTSAPHLIIIKPYLLQQQGSLGGWLVRRLAPRGVGRRAGGRGELLVNADDLISCDVIQRKNTEVTHIWLSLGFFSP